ncbi:hypothetical protein KA977_10935, partial [Candidatus Dependentiae bacterium]|nr:hypothetical protein [Candidatus Dependentiae bacterium]
MKFEKIIFFVLFVFMFFSCGQNDKNNNIDNVETGGISLSLVWDTGDSNNQSQNAPAEKNSIKYAAPAGVVTIRVTISGTGMNDISQSFAASAGSGTITGVPVGSNRTAKIEGYDASNNVIYYAYKTNITVQQNLTTNAGTVTMISATKPYIDHTAVGTSSKDNAITITALVNDYTNVNSVTLYYKKNSDANYTSVSMKKTSGDYYSEVIPANIVTENVTYYISAYNGINYIYCGSSGISNSNPSSNPITVTILTTSRILFDNFPNSVLNSSIWNTASSGILNNFYFYSSQYSYRLNQTNALISNSVNLNQNDGTLYLDFYYRPYNGVSTDKLYAKFYDSNGVWQTLTSLTAGDSSYWRLGRVNIPYYNLHSNFKLKLESSTAYPNYYFFVDDILLKRLYPLITHSAVDNVKSGATANISANIASENSISSVKLFYKKSNSNAYSDTDMLKTSGTTYQANLPSSYLTTGIDYFIQATDNNITSYYDNKGLNVSGFYPMTIKLNLLDDSFYSTQWNSIWYDKSSSEITSNDYITSPYSMRLKYVDYIYTNAMNLSSSSDNLTLSFYYKGSGTTSTDKLYVKYYDSNSTWQMLSDTIVGTPFSSWLYQTIFIPTVYLHSNFKLRFEAATSSTSKYFYIDNIQLKTTVEDAMYTISTPMPAPGSTITRGTSGQSLMIKCPGATGGTFYYDVDNNLSYNVAGTMDSDFLKVNVPYGSVMTNSGYNNWYVKVNYPDGRQITYPEKASNTKGFLQFNVTSTQIVSNPYPAQGSLIKTTSLFQTFRVHCPGASYARFYYSTYSSFYYYGNTSYITPTGEYIECAVPYSNSYITNNGINYWYAQIYYPNNSSIRFPASMYVQ